MSLKGKSRLVSRRRALKAAGAAAVGGGASALLGGGTAAAQQGAPAIVTNTQAGRRIRAFVKLDKVDVPSVQTLRLRALGSRMVAVRTEASQTCYSSVGQVLLPSPTPSPRVTVVGHGGVGIVEAVGPDVFAIRPGDRVMVAFAAHCGWCYNCTQGRADQCLNSSMLQEGQPLPMGDMDDGKPVYGGSNGMAEVMVVNQERLIPIFSDVSSAELAMLPCVGNAGLGMVMAKTPIEPGSDVVVFGAGPVGLAAIQGANIKGAARIIVVEPIQYRRDLALKLGGTDGVDPWQYNKRSGPVANFGGINGDFYQDALVDHLREMVKQKTDRSFAGGGRIGPDHVVEAAGGNAYGGVTTKPSAGGGPDPTGMVVLSQVWHLCSQAGTAVSCSIGFPPGAMVQIPANQFCDGAKHWRGGTGGGTNIRRDVPRYVRLMERGKLNTKVMAQRTYPLAQATEAYRVAMNREVVATIVTPNA
jgi:S-(hydroxymethyl)glutathione dehydrogenase/alcohol dehydrogenase